jgi:hypothetical protein
MIVTRQFRDFGLTTQFSDGGTTRGDWNSSALPPFAAAHG